ncbi:MAG TPA: flagellar hook-length control protein FliK, partial [Methylocella sp.]|nr:flagellar hook-length control protein FliK [Methylocella sp.]
MKGIEGFLGKPSVLPDPRGAPTGGGAHNGPEIAATFGGHLAELSRQESLASGRVSPPIFSNPALPALVQPSFLFSAGAAQAAKLGVPEAEVEVAGVSQEISLTQGGDASATDSEVLPAVNSPPSCPHREPDVLGVLTKTPVLVNSSFAVAGDPSLTGFTPTEQPKTQSAEAASAEVILLGTTIASGVSRKDAPLGAPAFFPAERDTAQMTLSSNLASRAKLGRPHGSTGTEALLASLPAAAVSVPVSAEEDAHGLDSSRRPLELGRESSLDRVATANISKPEMVPAGDPSSDQVHDVVTSVRTRIFVVDSQAHLAPANSLFASQQTASTELNPPLARSAGGAVPRALLVVPGLLSRNSDRDNAAVQDLVATENLVTKHAAAPGADPKGGHEAGSITSAPIKGLAANPQSSLEASGRPSPGQQVGDFIVKAAGPSFQDPTTNAQQSSHARETLGLANAQPSLSRVQTMQLQLDPESLGKVTVNMRLSGSRLDLRLAAERPETMQLIGKDKDLLTCKLQAAGYSVESLVVQAGEAQAPHQPPSVNVPLNGQT